MTLGSTAKGAEFKTSDDGILHFKGRISVSDIGNQKE